MKQKIPQLIKLGHNIRTLREAKNLSQEQLASIAQLDRTYIGGVERGERNISILNLCRIANALKVYTKQILEGVDIDGHTK